MQYTCIIAYLLATCTTYCCSNTTNKNHEKIIDSATKIASTGSTITTHGTVYPLTQNNITLLLHSLVAIDHPREIHDSNGKLIATVALTHVPKGHSPNNPTIEVAMIVPYCDFMSWITCPPFLQLQKKLVIRENFSVFTNTLQSLCPCGLCLGCISGQSSRQTVRMLLTILRRSPVSSDAATLTLPYFVCPITAQRNRIEFSFQ